MNVRIYALFGVATLLFTAPHIAQAATPELVRNLVGSMTEPLVEALPDLKKRDLLVNFSGTVREVELLAVAVIPDNKDSGWLAATIGKNEKCYSVLGDTNLTGKVKEAYMVCDDQRTLLDLNHAQTLYDQIIEEALK